MEFEKELFSKSTKDLGNRNVGRLSIDTGDAKPIKQRPYKTPFSQRPIIETEINDMLDANVIRPSCSPWSSLIVVVGKQDGGHRFCVDFRKLNSVISHNSYPLPNIDDMLAFLGETKYCTCLDLKSGFWQIEIKEGDKHKTAFTCHLRLFEFKTMPFHLASGQSVFSSLMDHVLMGAAAYALCYIDDIIVFTDTFEETHFLFRRCTFQMKEIGIKI